MVTIRSIVFLLGISLSGNAYSLSIAIEKSTPEGILQKAITLKKDGAILTKNSNYFDENSQEVGLYKINNEKKLSKLITELKRLEKALNLIATKVSKPTSLKKPHHEETYIKLNSHFISDKHPLFKEIDENLANLFKQAQTKAMNTMRVQKEEGFLVKVISKNGKETKSSFSPKQYCRNTGESLVCTDDQYGTLFVK